MDNQTNKWPYRNIWFGMDEWIDKRMSRRTKERKGISTRNIISPDGGYQIFLHATKENRLPRHHWLEKAFYLVIRGHYGSKQSGIPVSNHLLSDELRSEWVIEQMGALIRVELVNEWALWANKQVSGPLVTSQFLTVLDHSAYLGLSGEGGLV